MSTYRQIYVRMLWKSMEALLSFPLFVFDPPPFFVSHIFANDSSGSKTIRIICNDSI